MKEGQKVKRGDILGPMATKEQFGDPNMRPIVGSGTDAHTSLDFLKVGSAAKHPHWRELTRSIDFNFSTSPSNGGGSGGGSVSELRPTPAVSPTTTGSGGGRLSSNYGGQGGPKVSVNSCLLYTSPSPRDLSTSRMPSSA